MKKILITLLVLSIIATMTGCNNKKVESTSTNDNTQTEQAEDTNKENNKRSNEEMYEIYEDMLPEVKAYYESLGVSLKEERSKKVKDYEGNTYIHHTNYDNKNLGEFSVLEYGFSFYPDGKIDFLLGSMYMNIDGDNYKDGSFKIEESPFYELIKIFGADKLDYTSINKKINDYFQGNGSDLIERTDGQFSERINLSNGEIAYIININP